MDKKKTLVITGSTSGLGMAAAASALASGAQVVVSSEQSAALQQTLEEFAGYGKQVTGIVCDVSNWNDVEALKAFALEKFGQIDCWINNAGTTAPSGAAVNVPRTLGELLISTNVLGTYFGTITAIREFHRQGQGRLINLVGRGEKGPVKDAALYGSSKAWVRNFTLAIAREEKDSAIEVGTFNPGLTLTALTAQPQVLRGEEERMLKGLRTIMPLLGDTADKAGGSLAQLALQTSPIRAENSHRRLLPHVLKRLLTGKRADIDPQQINPRIVEPEK